MALAFDFSWSISWWKSSTFMWFFLEVTKNNKRSKLKDISIAACHIILPSLLLTKIIQEFCDLFYPLGNNFYELSILPVLLNLLLDLRTHFKASNRKNFNFFSSGRLKNVSELTPPGSTISGRYFHLKRMSISILVPSFFAKNKHGRRGQFFLCSREKTEKTPDMISWSFCSSHW